MSKVIGIIPARLGSSRFPNKPLADIHGHSMLNHVYRRSLLAKNLTDLYISSCDDQILSHASCFGAQTIKTAPTHTRALDRVFEAATKIEGICDEDIIVCIQGDEPMLRPDMIEKTTEPILKNDDIEATVLGLEILDYELWINPNTVKIVSNAQGKVQYTSRSPVPYMPEGCSLKPSFSYRIYGILAFTMSKLRMFYDSNESFLETAESCDSNRIFDLPFDQYIVKYPEIVSYSVDCHDDLELVRYHILSDPYFKEYGFN